VGADEDAARAGEVRAGGVVVLHVGRFPFDSFPTLSRSGQAFTAASRLRASTNYPAGRQFDPAAVMVLDVIGPDGRRPGRSLARFLPDYRRSEWSRLASAASHRFGAGSSRNQSPGGDPYPPNAGSSLLHFSPNFPTVHQYSSLSLYASCKTRPRCGDRDVSTAVSLRSILAQHDKGKGRFPFDFFFRSVASSRFLTRASRVFGMTDGESVPRWTACP